MIPFLKLQEVMPTRPVILPGMQFLMIGALTGSVVLGAVLIGGASLVVAAVLGAVGLLTGVLLVLPVRVCPVAYGTERPEGCAVRCPPVALRRGPEASPSMHKPTR